MSEVKSANGPALSIWKTEGDFMAGLLVQEIRKTTVWARMHAAGDALFHVRLQQEQHEREAAYFGGDAPCPDVVSSDG